MSSDTPPTAASQASVLRRAWLDVAATAAPQLDGLPALLEQRLDDLEGAGALDEPSLLAVAEECSQYALEQGAGEVARALSKRLRRAIYEFLLALDAVNPAELANAPALTSRAPVEPPRTPVAFTPADVPGGDEPVAVAPPAPAAPVPLWEAVAPPPRVREVYQVATRGVEPVAPAVDEMGGEPDAALVEFEEAEGGADVAEAQITDAETHAAEVAEAVASEDVAPAVVAEGHTADVEQGVPVEPVAEWEDDAAPAHAEHGVAAAGRNGSTETAAEAQTGDDHAEWQTVAAAQHPDTADADWPTASPEAAAEAETAAGADHPDSEWQTASEREAGPADAESQTVSRPWVTAETQTAPLGEHPEPTSDVETTAVAHHAGTPGADWQAVLPLAAAEAETAAVAEHPDSEWHAASQPEGAGDVEHHDARGPVWQAAAEHHAGEGAPTAESVPAAQAADAEAATAELAETTASTEPEQHVEPATWQAPVVELPAQPTAETPQLHVVHSDEQPPAPPANGARPPRELLRVPRQFRRLPPLANGHQNGAPATPPAAQPIQLPPVAAQPPAAELEPDPDDDLLGVPSVPWTLAEQPAPAADPEPPAAEAAPEPDPEPEPEGVPFNPFAAFPPDEDEELPRPPALAEEPLHPAPGAAGADSLFIQPLPGNDAPQLWTPGPAAPPPYAVPLQPPAAEPFPIAPREGFHLTDPGAFIDTPLPAGIPLPPPAELPAAAATAPAPVAPEQPAAHEEPHDDPTDDGVWRIRQSPRAQLLAERMAQKRREEAARAAFEAASVHDDDRRQGRRRGKQDDAVPDLPSARRQLDEHLRKKRGAEAGALLQRLAQEIGGRDIADLALDAGDRCRALGQSRSATNCYLAAWRADPLYETPLWRLSDICLNDQEIDLAVGYLERIAELMRSRGDDEGAIGVYRKIAMIAPERQDVRDVIRLAKTTGRLEG